MVLVGYGRNESLNLLIEFNMPKKPKKGDLMITHIGDVNVYAILPNCPANSEKRRTYPQKFICNLPEGTLGASPGRGTIRRRYRCSFADNFLVN